MTDVGLTASHINSVADVLIVGAGPAGLATAAACLNAGFNVVVLEKSPTVGGWTCDKVCTGPAKSLYFSNANFTANLTLEPTSQDNRLYLPLFAAYNNITHHVRLSCHLTHLSFNAASSRWHAIFQDLSRGKRYNASADIVVLCTGHGLPEGDPHGDEILQHVLGSNSAHSVGSDSNAVVMHANEAISAQVSELAATAVTVVGDGKIALECASALALLRFGSGVVLVTYSDAAPSADGTNAGVAAAHRPEISGISLLDGARRRALHAALQPHPSLPAPGAVGRVLKAPTKRRFWAYVKGRAAAAVTRSAGAGGSGTTSSIPDSGAAAPAVASAIITSANAPVQASSAVPSELMQSRLVLWAPSFSDPRVMPFLDPAIRRALLLQGDSKQPSEQLLLYRGVIHPNVPGLAFVGWQAHATTPLLVLELQAQWLVALLTSRLRLPPLADMRADLARQQAWREAALASPLMSTRGSLARTHDGHYIRQLLADLSGLVELRPRSSLLSPSAEQQRWAGTLPQADGLWSNQVLISMSPRRRPTSAAVQLMSSAEVTLPCKGAAAEVWPNGEGSEPAASPAGLYATTSPVGYSAPRQLASVQLDSELCSPRPGGSGSASDAGCIHPACGGVLSHLGLAARPQKAGPAATAPNLTTAPELQLPLEVAGGRPGQDRTSPYRRNTFSVLPYLPGVSDAGCSGGSAGGVGAGAVGSAQSSCGTGWAKNDSTGNKLSTKAPTASQSTTSGHFVDLVDTPLIPEPVDRESSKAATTRRVSGAVTATCQDWVLGLGTETVLTEREVDAHGEGDGSTAAKSPELYWERCSGPVALQPVGAAQAGGNYGRDSAASLPLLKLLPLGRGAQASVICNGNTAVATAAAATTKANNSSTATTAMQSPVTVDQASNRKQQQKRGGILTRQVKRSAPRRSLSYSDMTSVHRDAALRQNARHGSIASAITPNSIEAQLAALQSHLLDPAAVPFPRTGQSARLIKSHTGVGTPAFTPHNRSSALASPIKTQGASSPAVSASGTGNSAALTRLSPVGGVNPLSSLLHLSRCSVDEEGEAGSDAGGGEGGSKRLTTIEERHMAESVGESADHQQKDISSEGVHYKPGQQPNGRKVGRKVGAWVAPTIPDSGNPEYAVAVSMSQAFAADAASVGNGAGGGACGSIAKQRLPPRRSQTTSCLGETSTAAAAVMSRAQQKAEAAASAAAMAAAGEIMPVLTQLRCVLPAPAALSPKLRSLHRVSVGAGELREKASATAKAALLGAVASTEAFFARMSSPRSSGSAASMGSGISPFRGSAGDSCSGFGAAESVASPPAAMSRLARPVFANKQQPSIAAAAVPLSGLDSSSTHEACTRSGLLKAKTSAAADRGSGGSGGGASAASIRATASGTIGVHTRGSAPHNMPSLLKHTDAGHTDAGDTGLGRSLGGLLGGAAEAARLPYRERMYGLAPSPVQHDPLLRRRRAMAIETAPKAITPSPPAPKSSKEGSLGSALRCGVDSPRWFSGKNATDAAAEPSDAETGTFAASINKTGTVAATMFPATTARTAVSKSTSMPLPRWTHGFETAWSGLNRGDGSDSTASIVAVPNAAGRSPFLPSPVLPLPSAPPEKDDKKDMENEREEGLFDMDLIISLHGSIGCPQELAAPHASLRAAPAAERDPVPPALAELLQTVVPDVQAQTPESILSVDRRLMEKVEALAAASGKDEEKEGAKGTGTRCGRVTAQEKVRVGGDGGATALPISGAPFAAGSSGVESDGRRGPAWVVRRASQVRQDQLVGEISSWLREALVRKASNITDRPDTAAAAATSPGELCCDTVAMEEGEEFAVQDTASAAVVAAGNPKSRIQGASGTRPAGYMQMPHATHAAPIVTSAPVPAAVPTFGAPAIAGPHTPRRRPPPRSQTLSCLASTGQWGSLSPTALPSPVLSPLPSPPPPPPIVVSATAATAATVVATTPPSAATVVVNTAATAAPATAAATTAAAVRSTAKRLPHKAASLRAGELRERMLSVAADAMSYLKRPAVVPE